ncbi:MAG TPA: translocation/assembly module TamB domain-containing protein [Usitatibacter sp.]|jgi:translocation and assembly module TamB|nr:translocation/assembly module TamB domain-containing protein [Usitatibacter sp.]
MAVAPDPVTTPLPRPPRRGRALLRALLLTVLVLLAVIVAGAWWLLGTSSGTQVVMGQLARRLGPGLQIEGARGRLGGAMHVDRIVLDRPDLQLRLEDVDLDSTPPLAGRFVVHKLHAREVSVHTAPSGKKPQGLPASFALPLGVAIEDARIDTLRAGKIGGEAAADLVLHDIVLQGEADARRIRIDQAAVTTAYGRASATGTLGAVKPFDVHLDVKAAGSAQGKPYDVAGELRGTLESLQARARGTVAASPASAEATLTPFTQPLVRALSLDAAHVDLARFAASLPPTDLAVHAKLEPQGDGFAGPVRLENGKPGPWDRGQLPFRAAAARVTADAQRVHLAGLDVALAAGGRVQGEATYASGRAQARLTLANVDLSALQTTLQKTDISGTASVSGDTQAQRFEVALKDPRFGVEGRGALASSVLTVEAARVTTGGGVLTAQGDAHLQGDRAFHFTGHADHFDPSAFVKTARGDLNFGFDVTGKAAGGIAGEAKLDIAPSTYSGLAARGRVHVAGDAQRIALADVDLAVADAHLQAKGSFGGPRDGLDLAFDVPDIAALARPFGVDAAGHARGTAHLDGTFRAPAGRVQVTGGDLSLPSQTRVAQLVLDAQAGVDPASAIHGTLQAQGIVRGTAAASNTLAQSVHAKLDGTRAHHRLDLDVAITRDSTFHATLEGGEQRAGVKEAWAGQLTAFGITGPGSFSLQSPAPLYLGAQRVELGEAPLKGEWGEARLTLTRWTPRGIELRGSSPGIVVRTVARTLKLWNVTRSDLVIAGDWDIRALETFDGTLDVHRVSGDLRVGQPPLPLGLEALALRLDSTRGRARATVSLVAANLGRIEGDGTGLIVRGSTGWSFAREAPIQARLQGDVPDLSVLAPWLGIDAKLGGRVDLDLAVTGTGADPRVDGSVTAASLAVREPQSGFEISDADVALRLAGHSLTIERFAARTPWRLPKPAQERFRNAKEPAGGGALSAQGSIDLAARTGTLTIHAQDAAVSQLATRFVAVTGDAHLAAAADGLAITGAFTADPVWVGAPPTAPPSPSDDIVVVRPQQPAQEEPAKGAQPVTLDLRVALGRNVYFEGRGLDTRLAGDIRLTGQVGGALRAAGSIRTVGGTYEGYGQKLAIERGVIVFNGALDNPQLNVLALRKGLPVEAGVEVLGTVARPHVRLVSTPDVPEPEKLSWLVLGRSASDATLGDSAVLMAAARALLGNNNTGSDLTKRLGFDEFKIGRADTNSVLGVLPENTVAGRTGQPSAAEVVSVGKRINNRIQLTYEQGIAAAEGTLKLTYRISRPFQVLVRVGYLPGLDAVWRWTFR